MLYGAGLRGDLVFSWTALCLNKCWSMEALETARLPRESLSSLISEAVGLRFLHRGRPLQPLRADDAVEHNLTGLTV